MLRHTFSHLQGIGPTTEFRLWESGLTTWDEVTDFPHLLPKRLDSLPRLVEESRQQLVDGNIRWFLDGLASSESWRVWSELAGETAYVDIETDGLSHTRGGAITTICLWDGENLKTYVQGENLRNFIDDLHDYRMIVTYNGSSFDVPFIESWFNEQISIGHVDVRHPLASLGITGGLKECERKLGLDRGELADVDGMFAVHLWRDFLATGRIESRDTLLAYNALDAINLAPLMGHAYNGKLADTPFDPFLRVAVPEPQPRSVPAAHPNIIEEIRTRLEERHDEMRAFARDLLGPR